MERNHVIIWGSLFSVSLILYFIFFGSPSQEERNVRRGYANIVSIEKYGATVTYSVGLHEISHHIEEGRLMATVCLDSDTAACVNINVPEFLSLKVGDVMEVDYLEECSGIKKIDKIYFIDKDY